MPVRPLLVLLAALALLLPGAARAENPRLVATVGPGFTISLADASGAAVAKIEPGTYDISVRDLSDEHNFHLFGPGVDRATDVAGTGTSTWTVTFRDGRYTFVCDPHPSSMRGTFTVGNPPAAPAPSPPPAAPKRLVATVGPGNAISLASAAGHHLQGVAAGTYTITVRDRSKLHNVHLVGPGIDRRTTVAGVGTTTWKVTLRRGKLTFFSDRAPQKLRRTLTVR
ncbi:MAG TPA: plastocyanin/azurin family copper-binding protein [Gaiellaceae bacterium]|nr:plastocyanin/azurin family copper-binding protein [Gaiellaceae bacterium]